eukprot:6074542-Amphidinium_carterae.1
MLGDPWSFLQSSTAAVAAAPAPSAASLRALPTVVEDVLEPDPPPVLPEMAELLAPMLKQIEELRKAQISQTKQVIDCLGTIAGALEQITRQQTLLLARTPAAIPAASACETVTKPRPKPSARPGMSLKPRAKQGRRPFRHVKHHAGSNAPVLTYTCVQPDIKGSAACVWCALSLTYSSWGFVLDLGLTSLCALAQRINCLHCVNLAVKLRTVEESILGP